MQEKEDLALIEHVQRPKQHSKHRRHHTESSSDATEEPKTEKKDDETGQPEHKKPRKAPKESSIALKEHVLLSARLPRCVMSLDGDSHSWDFEFIHTSLYYPFHVFIILRCFFHVNLFMQMFLSIDTQSHHRKRTDASVRILKVKQAV